MSFASAPIVVTNGTFAAGTANWQTFALPTAGDITYNVSNGVFQFFRTGTQAVAYQNTGVGVAANTLMTAQFQLGNSDTVRKRISVLVHDADFLDLHVCTFWLPASAPLRPYRITTHTTKAWTNATISFYAATAGSGGFYQLDDVALLAGAGSAATTTCIGSVDAGRRRGGGGP